MKMVLILIFLISLSLNAHKFVNELQYETSPYLQAHKNNPVNWMPWSKRAFEKAKKENKPIFVSIGYSTCHWCHVMERESFSNEALAKLFNKYFICIKVDREEMSHIDALYQQVFLKLHNRSGGWPLSIFMTPSKEVFYAGGYIPPSRESYAEGLDTLLERLGRAYEKNSPKFQKHLREYKKEINSPNIALQNSSKTLLSLTLLSDSLKSEYDEIYSGFGNTRKFPQAAKLTLMMDLAALQKDKILLDYSYEMLDMMALRGLYDQIEGGFFRYSVDAAWEIPHFEKMLYTQAELIPLYARAYRQTGKKLYRDVVEETIAMLKKKFEKNHLFYSASDAQSGREEGGYYLFTQKEIALTSLEYTENFEDKMHINIYEDARPKDFAKTQKILQKVRETKVYPLRDKKINTAWNAMMVQALYSAAIIDAKYAKMADNTLKALSQTMFVNIRLYHQTILGVKPKQKALLEDYSFLISALISSYEYNYDTRNLDFANYFLTQALEKFYKRGVWYLSDDTLHIKAGLKDKYYTSPLSMMLQNILKLAALKNSFKYEKIVDNTLKNLTAELRLKKSDVPALARAFLMQKLKIVTLKSNTVNLLKERAKIERVNYPYLLTKEQKYSKFVACTLRQCFAVDEKIAPVLKKIDANF